MRWLVPLVFALVVAGHYYVSTGEPPAAASGPSGWASYEFDEPEGGRVGRYVSASDYWLGLSYGLSAAFGTWCFLRILRLRRESLAMTAGGLTLSGVLWAGVCFLTGCCGSPMLPVYLGLLGPKFLSVTKPLTFVITALSILVGYAWMLRRAPKAIPTNVNARLHEAPGADPGQV